MSDELWVLYCNAVDRAAARTNQGDTNMNNAMTIADVWADVDELTCIVNHDATSHPCHERATHWVQHNRWRTPLAACKTVAYGLLRDADWTIVSFDAMRHAGFGAALICDVCGEPVKMIPAVGGGTIPSHAEGGVHLHNAKPVAVTP